MIPFFFSASMITDGNFISTNDLIGGGTSSPSIDTRELFLIFSFSCSLLCKIYFGGVQLVFIFSVYTTPSARSLTGCKGMSCLTLSKISFSSSTIFSVSVFCGTVAEVSFFACNARERLTYQRQLHVLSVRRAGPIKI